MVEAHGSGSLVAHPSNNKIWMVLALIARLTRENRPLGLCWTSPLCDVIEKKLGKIFEATPSVGLVCVEACEILRQTNKHPQNNNFAIARITFTTTIKSLCFSGNSPLKVTLIWWNNLLPRYLSSLDGNPKQLHINVQFMLSKASCRETSQK